MPANTENILKNRGVVKNQQMWNRQENLQSEQSVETRTCSTANVENILRNSRGKEVEVMVSAEITKYPAASSNFPEDSPNSLPSDERKMDNGEAKVPAGDCDGHCSVAVSEF